MRRLEEEGSIVGGRQGLEGWTRRDPNSQVQEAGRGNCWG